MIPEISQTEAHALIVQWMQRKDRDAGNSYGYDLYLPTMISNHFWQRPNPEVNQFKLANMPAFTAAAWELCRRGILRPGVHYYGGQGTSDGYGYSVTPLGEAWLAESNKDRFIAIEPTQIAKMLGQYRSRFGDRFQERAQEAIRCYLANAPLACCAMCGAAAESILLAVAFARSSEEKVLAAYRSERGRRKVKEMAFGSAQQNLLEQAEAGLGLLKYWRDDAAHGGFSAISENQAFTSTLLLLKLAALVNDHWAALIAHGSENADESHPVSPGGPK